MVALRLVLIKPGTLKDGESNRPVERSLAKSCSN